MERNIPEMRQKLVFCMMNLIFIFLSGVAPSQISNAVDITIDRNGVLLNGRFYFSDEIQDLPTAILLQGFPGNEIDVLGIGSKHSKAGINAMTFNYSGTYKSQGEFNWENTQKDIQAAFEFIYESENIRKFKIDTNRIYLGGYSYGGGMALTYAANHPEIKAVFSIAGTDHGEFMKEYNRNFEMQKMMDDIFAGLNTPAGPVKFAKGGTPKEITEMKIIDLNPTFHLRKSASLLAQKDILLIGGWEDNKVSIDHMILPFYRALKNEKANKVKIVAFQDDHTFQNSREEVAKTITVWIKTASERDFR